MPRDVRQVMDGDSTFKGVAPRLDPALLAEGVAAEARNMRFRNGVAETRKGVYKPGWINNLTPEIDAKVRPFGEVHGVGVFSNPNNLEFIIIAADGKTYYTRQNNNPVEMPLPAGVVITGEVTFVQAFNKLIMFRGDHLAPLVMTSEDTGFTDMLEQWDSSKVYAVNDQVAFGPLVSVSGIAHANGTATVTTSAAHGYVTGADVTIAGANESEFNGRFSVTVTTPTAFTYTVASSNSASTGTVTCTNNADYYECSTTTAAGESPSSASSKWTELANILPNSTGGVFIANRIAAPTTYDSSSTTYGNKRDFVTVTDSLALTTFFNQIFRVNAGSDSEVVDLLRYDENRLLVLKSKDVHMITGFIVTDTNTTLSGSVSIQPVIQNYGVSGRGAAVVVGSDVYFYASRRGVVSMAQTEQSAVRGVDVPLSEPIQPLIDRIDSRYENRIRLAYWDNKLWVACPLDDGTNGNNTILVFDFLNQAWSGYDSGTAICPKEFITATYNGAQRLFMVGEDGFISLLEENVAGDDVADLTQGDGIKQEDVESYLLTRGYNSKDADHREFRTATLNVSTWNPKYTVKSKLDGVAETQVLTSDNTKDRTAYYRPFDAPAWVRSNYNDDFNKPYREDYSVVLDATRGVLTEEDGDPLAMEGAGGLLLENGLGGFNLGSNGVAFNYMQETLEPFTLEPRTGRFTQMEVTNTQGVIAVKQVAVSSDQGDRTITVKS